MTEKSNLQTAGRLVKKTFVYLRTYGFALAAQKVIYYLRSRIVKPALMRAPSPDDSALRAQRLDVFPEPLTFSVIVPLYNTPESFLREMLESVLAQTYTGWELCLADGSDGEHARVGEICRGYAARDKRIIYKKLDENRGISGNTNACLDMASGDWFVLFDHDDLLHPAALYELRRRILDTDADFLYTDEALFERDLNHIFMVHCKPDFTVDALRGNNYICHLTAFSRELLEKVGAFRREFDGSQDHDFVLRATEKAAHIEHIRKVLYYWRSHPDSVALDVESKPYALQAGLRAVQESLERAGVNAVVEPAPLYAAIYRIRYALSARPSVSVVMRGRDADTLRKSVAELLNVTDYPQLNVVACVPDSVGMHSFADRNRDQRIRFLFMQELGGVSAADLNRGAAMCEGEQLLFLDESVYRFEQDWLEELLMFAQRPDAGAVGGKIFSPKKRILESGQVPGFGAQGAVGCPFRGMPDGSDGYNGRLYYAQEYSCVSPMLMLVPRSAFNEAGGFCADFPDALYGADLCLRLRERGYRVYWTPYSIVYANGSTKPVSVEPHEAQRFRSRWAQQIEQGDPFYSAEFKTTLPGFRLK